MSTSKLGVSTHVSKKFLDETVRLRNRINFLKTQNEGYDESQKLANETKDAKTRMEDARKSQLDTVQTIINQEMVRMNDFIYDGKQYAPEIKFSDARMEIRSTPSAVIGIPAQEKIIRISSFLT